ncbi:unnamed protein product [Paramecium octaurelia]|uniref:Uncharacterized protein n=1 Tax=Paramecium octaurelia TaxID=43137 RepID=A0A8S1XRM6_PAROT|nr:unnamed protein product [Paramecium octaurelia]
MRLDSVQPYEQMRFFCLFTLSFHSLVIQWIRVHIHIKKLMSLMHLLLHNDTLRITEVIKQIIRCRQISFGLNDVWTLSNGTGSRRIIF